MVFVAVALLPAAAHAAKPAIPSTESAIVEDATTGEIVFQQQIDTQRSIASTTKLMTVLLALEHGNLKGIMTAPRYRASPVESLLRPQLSAGEEMSEADLIRGALIVSANDAAFALASNLGGGHVDQFVTQMNAKAKEIGLTNTSYANPIGLDDPDNYSTARDLATLTRKLETFPFFNQTVDTEGPYTLKTGTTRPPLINRNELLARDPWVNGVKTGTTTDAGSVLVASGTQKQGTKLIAVVMHATSKDLAADQAEALLNYGFTQYHEKTAISTGDTVKRVPIQDRPGAELPLVSTQTVKHMILKGKRYQYVSHVPATVKGPIGIHQHIGTIDVKLDDKVIATVPLESTLKVPKASKARKAQDFLTHPWILGLLGVILLAGSLVAARRKKPPPRSRREKEVA